MKVTDVVLLHVYQVVDLASVVFRDPYGCWGFLDLWRIDGAASAFSAGSKTSTATFRSRGCISPADGG